MSPRNNPVAGVVIRNEQGEYLLVQEKQPKAYGLWNLPAGWIDEGETPQQTAIREAKEELGLEVELVHNEPLHKSLNDDGTRELISFLAKVVSGELKPQETELLGAKWLSVQAVQKLLSEGKLRNRWTLESIKKAEET
jgi:8-oxo-dGTP diphosphatase